jgi:stage II sporulation protein D
VALATGSTTVVLGSDGPWQLLGAGRHAVLADNHDGSNLTVELRGREMRVRGRPGDWQRGPLVATALGGGSLSFSGRRYRGELVIHATDIGATVVNVLAIDEYLRGVVPLEIGRGRTEQELAAIEAQVVVARSYAYTRLGAESATWDLRASTLDQVYGGIDAETALSDRAIAATSEMVLRFGSRIVNAPYHSTCGGRTAGAAEIWRTSGEPFLRSVDDVVPGTSRYWCEISPRFRFSRSWDAVSLQETLNRNLPRYTTVPPSGPGSITGVAILGRTTSGRVAELEVTTASGARYRLRGNDIRFVLRGPAGELLESTNFNLAVAQAPGGGIARLSVSGSGFGHGVGMCQWGAIARARAGWDRNRILGAYYPGTEVVRGAGG